MTTPTPRTDLCLITCPVCGSEGATSNEATINKELFGIRRELAAAQERAEQNAKDAERYRWLRDSASPSHQIPFVTSGADYGWGPEIVNGEPLDAAIDAAMKEKA